MHSEVFAHGPCSKELSQISMLIAETGIAQLRWHFIDES